MTRRPDVGNEDARVASQIDQWRTANGIVEQVLDPWQATDQRVLERAAAKTALREELETPEMRIINAYTRSYGMTDQPDNNTGSK